MKKILITLLIAISLCTPILVSAQEAPSTEDTEVVIPVYFFANEDGNVLGITLISEELFLWFYPLSEKEVQIAQEAGAGVVRVNFTGHMYDDATDLYYMGARYQNPEIGRFVSEDPVFLSVGTQGTDENGQKQLRKYLSDPQGFSSYSYARNNPLRYIDPNGEWFKEFLTGQQSWGSFQGEVGEATMYMSSTWQTAMDHPYATGAAVGIGSGAAAQALVASGVAGTVLSSSGAIRGGINATFNVAGQMLDDQITGNRTSAKDYAKIVGISYAGGALTGPKVGVIGSAGIAGVANLFAQTSTGDRSINPVKIGASMLGNGFGSWAGNFAGKTSGLGSYSAMQYGISKIGSVIETPINIIDSGIKNK